MKMKRITDPERPDAVLGQRTFEEFLLEIHDQITRSGRVAEIHNSGGVMWLSADTNYERRVS